MRLDSSTGWLTMRVFNTETPDKALANIELSRYVRELKIPHICGVLMRDTSSRRSSSTECTHHGVIGNRTVSNDSKSPKVVMKKWIDSWYEVSLN